MQAVVDSIIASADFGPIVLGVAAVIGAVGLVLVSIRGGKLLLGALR